MTLKQGIEKLSHLQFTDKQRMIIGFEVARQARESNIEIGRTLEGEFVVNDYPESFLPTIEKILTIKQERKRPRITRVKY